MLALPYISLPSDHPFWISREVFFTHFDQHDFVFYRDVECVELAFRSDWFLRENTRLKFILPVVSYAGDKTQFINGRHRVAVLLQVLQEIPIALASESLSPAQLQLRSAIPKRSLNPVLPFELPDLPYLPGSGTIEEY